jgi:hypothetical protein
MAINFPNNPIDGNTYEYASVRYKFVDLGSGSGFWKTITADSGPATVAEINAGTEPDKYATPINLEASKYQAALSYLVPTGMISLWHGNTNTIPTGWTLCDGTGGTPDLRDRFVVGASGAYAVGATGGYTDTIVVDHGHTASNTGASGTHSHGGGTNNQGTHSHSGDADSAGFHDHNGSTTSNAGNHSHVQYHEEYHNNHGSRYNRDSSDKSAKLVSRNTDAAGIHNHNVYVAGDGSHGHTLSIDDNGDHSHSITTDIIGNHTHSVSIGDAGSSGTDKNIPPFYALAYIMKT